MNVHAEFRPSPTARNFVEPWLNAQRGMSPGAEFRPAWNLPGAEFRPARNFARRGISPGAEFSPGRNLARRGGISSSHDWMLARNFVRRKISSKLRLNDSAEFRPAQNFRNRARELRRMRRHASCCHFANTSTTEYDCSGGRI